MLAYERPRMPDRIEKRLVNTEQLRRELWEVDSAPSIRWIRYQQAKRAIPFVKIGQQVWFNPDAVRRTLEERFGVNPRGTR